MSSRKIRSRKSLNKQWSKLFGPLKARGVRGGAVLRSGFDTNDDSEANFKRRAAYYFNLGKNLSPFTTKKQKSDRKKKKSDRKKNKKKSSKKNKKSERKKNKKKSLNKKNKKKSSKKKKKK